MLCRQYDIIPLLTDAAQSAAKEKVVRIIVATFSVSGFCASYSFLNGSIELGVESAGIEFTGNAGRETSSICQESLYSEMVGRRYRR